LNDTLKWMAGKMSRAAKFPGYSIEAAGRRHQVCRHAGMMKACSTPIPALRTPICRAAELPAAALAQLLGAPN
jgi:hypothetical protein